MSTPLRVVFDCMIYTQALISSRGPAAACLELVRQGKLHLVWSDYVLQEIRELPGKLPAKLNVTPERVEAFLLDVAPHVEYVVEVPNMYENPFDIDDSHYINLAVSAKATVITSRDKDNGPINTRRLGISRALSNCSDNYPGQTAGNMPVSHVIGRSPL